MGLKCKVTMALDKCKKTVFGSEMGWGKTCRICLCTVCVAADGTDTHHRGEMENWGSLGLLVTEQHACVYEINIGCPWGLPDWITQAWWRHARF